MNVSLSEVGMRQTNLEIVSLVRACARSGSEVEIHPETQPLSPFSVPFWPRDPDLLPPTSYPASADLTDIHGYPWILGKSFSAQNESASELVTSK